MQATLPGTDELLDEAPCGLLVTDLDGTIRKVNKTFCGWLGTTSEALVGRKRLQELFTMGGRIFHQTHWVPTLQMQGSLAEVKFDLRRDDGQTVPMILNARRRKRAEGEFDEIAAFVAQDRNRYERELMNARKRADALLEAELQSQSLLRDRALFAEQMVGIVSHDLRNPLAAILTGVQLMERSDTDRRTRVLAHVRGSAERARRLIEDLLDFTQTRLGKGLSLTLRDIDLHAVAGQTLEELRLAYPTRQLVLDASGPGACTADADRLAQLLINLVSNAASYGDEASAITLRTQTDAGWAEVSVHNHGRPIATDMLDKLFEPMVRGETGGLARSVGLGLYIVSEIAKAHGGRMQVMSTAEDGTRFALRFPAVPVATSAASMPSASSGQTTDGATISP